MTATDLSRVTFALFLFSLATLGLAGRPAVQCAALALTLALSVMLVLGLARLPEADGFSRLVSYAVLGCLAFALWNLAVHPNERWAHRTFIYTSYAAAAAIVLLATSFDEVNKSEGSKWCFTVGLWVVATVSILLVKTCFANRMMTAAI